MFSLFLFKNNQELQNKDYNHKKLQRFTRSSKITIVNKNERNQQVTNTYIYNEMFPEITLVVLSFITIFEIYMPSLQS